MNLELTEEQLALRDTVRRFLADKASIAGHVRPMLDDPTGTTELVWRGLAELGTTGLLVSPEYNGAGMTMVEAGVVLEELGAGLHPGPWLSTAVAATRALAATANTFARESHLDELAHRLDQDPLDLRLAHVADERLEAALEAVAERIGWARRARGSGHGMGIAGGIEKEGRIATAVEVRALAGRPLEIVRIVTAYDCGAVVNPHNLASQIEGATVMGLGGALFEAIHFEDGRVLNPAFSQYRVPRFHDVPPIDVILLDRKDVPPAGAGETPMIALAPALANAVFEATGRRLRALPLLPDEAGPAQTPR